MNHNGEDPGEQGGLGDVLPAEVLKKLNELLERLHQAEHPNHGGNIINIYASGSQHVDRVENQYINCTDRPLPQPLPREGGEVREGRTEGNAMPEALSTEAAMGLWQKVLEAGYVDDRYQPAIHERSLPSWPMRWPCG